jgi:hypothetical protein
MIIWKGFGILVGIVGAAAILLGSVVAGAAGFGGLSGAVGMGLAAVANWGLWKMIYPKKPQILIDPTSGRQFLNQPQHSLFFIPARAWTWIFAILALPVGAMGIMAGIEEKKQAATPGYAEFNAADDLIDSKKNGVAHGSSESAKASAELFSTVMKRINEEAFSGGSKRNLMTGGDFLTYCHDTEDEIVFICHVPELRNYKSEESKSALADIAWGSAKAAARLLDPNEEKTLSIGLRGISTYGILLKHQDRASDPVRSDSLGEVAVLFPGFAKPAIAASPSPSNVATEENSETEEPAPSNSETQDSGDLAPD